MANTLKLMIPLLNENFKLSDFTESVGFVDGYLEDINRPSLVNHIFLLYDGNFDTAEKIERDQRFRSFPSLYSRKIIFISGNPYMIYTFVCISKEMQRIRDGNVPYKREDLKKIMSFWTLNDDFIFKLACNDKVQLVTKGLVVPEEDYIPDFDDEFDSEDEV